MARRPSPLADGPDQLSRWQHMVLRYLAYGEALIREQGTTADREAFALWGMLWQPTRVGAVQTPSQRAALSRAVRRLERRGLVLRQNWRRRPLRARLSHADPGPGRTTHLELTPAGYQLAQRLITR